MKQIRYCKSLLLVVCALSLKAQATAEKQPILSVAFLEYLAEMTEVDGHLVGPQDLIEPSCLSQENSNKFDNEQKNDNPQPSDSPSASIDPECSEND